MTVIPGEMCNLRSVGSMDIDTILLWENDEEVRKAGSPEKIFTRRDIEAFVGRQLFGIEANGQLRLMIETKEGRSIGAVDLFDFDGASAEIGILVYAHDDRGKGYASEALRLLAAYATGIGMKRLRARVRTDNTACRRLFLAAGYEWRDENGTTTFTMELHPRQ